MKRICIASLLLSLWTAYVFAAKPVLTQAESSGAEGHEWNEMKGEKLLALQAKGDANRGAIAYEVCQGCHRSDASGRTSGAYPRLAGQHASVLIKQMTDIRANARDNPKMAPFIADHVLTPQEIADVAAYLQGLPIPNTNGRGPGTNLARGKELYSKDCATCHGTKGEGDATKFYPMLAAQHFKYLLRQTINIRDGKRLNANPKGRNALKSYTDKDLEAVSDYLSQLPPPK